MKKLFIRFGILVFPIFLLGDSSETIFVPNRDISAGIFHFYHQGDKEENYGFMFDKNFDKTHIIYAQPQEHKIETLSDGTVKLSFLKTDHYSYLQQALRDDFVVGQEGDIVKLLINGGDCVSTKNCTIAMNILTVIIPQEYTVIAYKGLDQNLKELVTKEWKIKNGNYTLMAPNTKGACLYLEMKKNTAPVTLSQPKTVTQTSELFESVDVTSNVSEKQKNQQRNVSDTIVFQNGELFMIGDVVLSVDGMQKIQQFSLSVKMNEKVYIKVFADSVAPKRLVANYPTAQIFSQTRAKTIYDELIKSGLSKDQIRFEAVFQEDEKTHVEITINPAQ